MCQNYIYSCKLYFIVFILVNYTYLNYTYHDLQIKLFFLEHILNIINSNKYEIH